MRKNLTTKNPVVIYGNKETEILSIMHAALKTGRAYVPVDVTYPIERLAKIVRVTETETVFNFTDIDITAYIPSGVKLVTKEELYKIISSPTERESFETEWVQGDDNCYILFTSGSTGEPKGVQISKNNLLNFVDWFEPYCETKNSRMALCHPSYSFDLSVINLFVLLPAGYGLFCIDKDMATNLADLYAALKDSDISVWVSTPSFMDLCSFDDMFDEKILPKLEKIIFIGETLTKKLVQTLWNKFPKTEVINGYGPTEGTVGVSACTMTTHMLEDYENALPIGYMMKNCGWWIENENKQAAEKEHGELIILGKSISKGYFKNPEVTAKVFFTTENGVQGYRTGDVVYRIGDLLYFCGRKDFQIKLNGYRIELDDIAENLNKLDCVNNNVVLPVTQDGKVSYLIAFIVPAYDLEMSQLKAGIYIKNQLKELIPSYMIPKRIVLLEDFPLNTNGKIDRKKLLEMYVK